MKQFTVKRNNKIIGINIEAKTASEAIDKAQDDYSYEEFGQGGALTERDVLKEDEYLNAVFTAVEEEDEIEKIDSVS